MRDYYFVSGNGRGQPLGILSAPEIATAATAAGSDPVDQTRGTSLLKTTTAAVTVTGTTLRHACNFAALAVLFNSRAQRRTSSNLHLTKFTLTPVLMDTWNARTRIAVDGAFSDGNTFGTSANL